MVEFLIGLSAIFEELKIVAPQTPEEQHDIFVLKKRVIDTLVERVDIDIDRNLFCRSDCIFSIFYEKMLKAVALLLGYKILRSKLVSLYMIYAVLGRSNCGYEE